MRVKFGISTVCYLEEDDRVLFLKFNKKWGQVYCPPGGKAEATESPSECILREFKEETGLDLLDLSLKGISYWNYQNEEYGVIFIYAATKYKGELKKDSEEGNLEWILKSKIEELRQFDMNSKFTDLVFEKGIFEGNFFLNPDDSVKEYTLKKI